MAGFRCVLRTHMEEDSLTVAAIVACAGECSVNALRDCDGKRASPSYRAYGPPSPPMRSVQHGVGGVAVPRSIMRSLAMSACVIPYHWKNESRHVHIESVSSDPFPSRCGWRERGRPEEDQTAPFGGTIFDQIRFQSELSYGFSSRWNCHLRVWVRGNQYPLRIGICLHCVCSVSAIHFHQGALLPGHISRSIVPEEALPVHLRLLQPLPTRTSMRSTHNSLRYRLLGALGPTC
jgi:hypothetical protein